MKKVLGIVLAMTMALGLVACGGNAGDTASTTAGGEATTAAAEASTAAAEASTAAEAASAASEEASTAEEPTGDVTTVTIWHQYTRGQQEYITKVVEDFNASHTDVKVVEEYQPGDNSEFQNKVYQAVMADNGPDIIIHFASEAAKYIADDMVVDLEQYLSADTLALLDSSLPQYKEEAMSFIDGKLHILPLVSSGPIFFYNKEVYDELNLTAPATWDELVANCEAIHAAYPDMAGFAFDSEVDGATMLIMQTGNQGFDAEGNIYFNTEEVAKQLQMYQDNNENDYFTRDKINNYFSNNFNQRVLASYVGSVAGLPYIGPDSDGAGPEVGMGIVPQTVGGTNWTPAWNRGAIIFNYGDEARIKGAASFVDYFATPEVNAGFCAAANYPAVFPATEEQQAYQDYVNSGDLGWQYLHPEYAGAFPAVTAYAYARTALGNLMGEVAEGVPVQEALNTAVEYIENELASE
ncbi:MAG: extracellular solute-binding protein [Lachnospiraceae bacterium]|nr:extracellular solute-binding protein [Lachnospiraceae bacterium]